MKSNANTTTSTENANIDELKGKFDAIRQNFEALGASEKSSAGTSYLIGRNLIELHEGNRYRQLKDEDGNNFKAWQDFCEKGCGFSRIYADRLMRCAKVQDRLENAGVTTVKQSVANLYMLHAAEGKHSIDIAAVWKAATGNSPEVFPERKAVSSAIHPQVKSSSKPNVSTRDKVRDIIKSLSENELLSLLTYIESLRKDTVGDNGDSADEVPAANGDHSEKVSA